MLDKPQTPVLLEALHVGQRLDPPLDPALQDAPHVPDAPGVPLAGDLQRLQNYRWLEAIPLAVPVQEFQYVRRRHTPHKAEVIVRRDPLRLGPYHLDLPDGSLRGGIISLEFPDLSGLASYRRMFQDLYPALTLHREPELDEGAQGILDALRSGAQEIHKLLHLDPVLADIGEDTE